MQRPAPHGTVLLAPAIEVKWDYNLLRVENAHLDVDAGTLAAEADAALGHLRHRRVEVEDERAGARLRPAFDALGWSTVRVELLVHCDPAAAAPDPRVVEGTPDAVAGLRREWVLADPDPPAGDVIAALVDADGAIDAALTARRLVVREGDAAAACAVVRFAGGGAEVSDVYCRPESRGRGYGRALVLSAIAAAHAAGADPVVIGAQRDDWPGLLYRRLGFAFAWLPYGFVLARAPEPGEGPGGPQVRRPPA